MTSYADLGFITFPVKQGEKRPAISGWQKLTQPVPVKPGQWTGGMPPPDVIVLDLDVKNNPRVVEDFEAECDLFFMDRTRVHRTPSGGLHVFYRCPELPTWNWVNGPKGKENPDIPTGIDSRVHGRGQIVLPPTPGYEVVADRPIADIPADLWPKVRRHGIETKWSSGAVHTLGVADGWAMLHYAKGERNVHLNKVAYALAQSDVSEASLVDTVDKINRFAADAYNRSAPLPADEAERTARSAFKAKQQGWSDHAVYQIPMATSAENLQNNLDAIGARLRYNELAKAIEVSYNDGEWQEFGSTGQEELVKRLQHGVRRLPNFVLKSKEKFVFELTHQNRPFNWGGTSQSDTADCMVYIAVKNRYDPWRDWLDGLPAWDRSPRIDTLLETCFRCDADQEYTRYISRAVFGGALTRTYAPGAKWDWVPVLIGKEDLGKSTYFRKLLPTDHLFGDNFSFADDHGRQIEATLGKIIVEAAEMTGATRADNSRIKAFISAQTDDYRLAYRKNKENIKRRWVMVGTSNPGQPLPGERQGNRRFLAIGVEKLPDSRDETHNLERTIAYLDEHREQLWTEALSRHRSGEDWLLPAHLKVKQREHADVFRYRPDQTMEEVVADVLPSLPARFRLSDLYQALNASPSSTVAGYFQAMNKGTDRRLAGVMRNLDPPVVSKLFKIDGKTRRLYENTHKGLGKPKGDVVAADFRPAKQKPNMSIFD